MVLMSSSKFELNIFMEQSALTLKYYRHIFLRIYKPSELVHFSTEKKSIDKRIRVQLFLEGMHVINRQTIFKEKC